MSLEWVPDPFLVDTPFGRGWAIFVETDHHDNWWTIELQKNGALVTLAQKEFTVARNYSLGIKMTKEELDKILGSKDD